LPAVALCEDWKTGIKTKITHYLSLDFVSDSIYTNKVKIIEKSIEFEWDRGNIDKNWLKHRVTNKESEESFFDKNKIIYKDIFHSNKEKRYILLGRAKNYKLLYIVFTIRNEKIRIISSRKTDKKEEKIYEKNS